MEKAKIRARLVERGTSYRQWAIAHNYQPRTAPCIGCELLALDLMQQWAAFVQGRAAA